MRPPLPSRPDETRLVLRGMRRHLAALGLACVDEMPLPSGRRADLMALSPAGDLWIIEIKSSAEDLRADQKWPTYRDYCDQLWFATTARVDQALFPTDAGLFIADEYGAEAVRSAPEQRIPAMRRKALTIRFARAGVFRLMMAADAGLSFDSEP